MRRTTLARVLFCLVLMSFSTALPAFADTPLVTPAPAKTALPVSPVTTPARATTPLPAPPAGTPSPVAAAAVAAKPVVVRVDVGGNGYKDTATRQVWEADRPFAPAAAGGIAWGYWGPRSMQVLGVSHPIAKTQFSPIYQTQRLWATGYRFDVPNGRYRVTVRMAELHVDAAPGSNLFDVVCQGQTVLAGVDIVKNAGKYTAYNRSFNAAVSSGSLTIRFVARNGLAAVAALDIESEESLTITPASSATKAGVASPSAVVTAARTAPVAATGVVTGSAALTATPAAAQSPAPTATRLPSPASTVVPPVTPAQPTSPAGAATATPSVTSTAPAAAATASPTSSATVTAAPTLTSSATAQPATTTPGPAQTNTAIPPSSTTAPQPSQTATTQPSRTPTAVATGTVALPVGSQLAQDSFVVVFRESDRQGAQDVLNAVVAIKTRLAEDLSLTVGDIEVRLFSNRQEYNEALGATAPADQVGNIVDQQHIWLLSPTASNATEQADILKGVQVEVVRLALFQVGNMPQWLRDGISSYEARLWNDARQQYMRSLVAMRRIASLRGPDGVTYNYLGGAVTAHTVIDYLTRTYGPPALTRLLESLKTRSFEQALRESTGAGLSDFDRAWVTYVNQTYGR